MPYLLLLYKFLNFSYNTYAVGTYKKRLSGALLMSTLNIYFCVEVRKLILELSSNTLPSQFPCSALDLESVLNK